MEDERDSVTARSHGGLAVAAINVSHAFAHLNNQAPSALWPVLQQEFGFGYMGIALLAVVNQVVVGPLEVVYGVLTRLYGRVRIMAVGTFVAFAGSLGMAGSQSYIHLVAARAVKGLGTSPNHPVGGAIMVDTFPRAQARALALYQTAGSVGGWLSPLLVGVMLFFLSWRWIFLILSIPVLLAAVMLLVVKEPSVSGGEEAGETRRRRARLGFAEYKIVLRDRNAMLVALVMAIGAAGRGAGGLNTYLTPFMVDRFGVTPPVAAMFLSVYTFAAVVGPLGMAWLADRTSPRLALRVTLVFSAIFNLLFLVPDKAGISLAAVIFLAGVFVSSRATLTQAMLISLGPKDVRVDTLLSLYGGIGAATGPVWTFITGMIVDNFGIPPAMVVSAVSYILGIFILGLIKLSPTATPATQPNNG